METTSHPEPYRLCGYLGDESGAGFRVPVFNGADNRFYTCRMRPSGYIKEFVDLPLHLNAVVVQLDASGNDEVDEYYVGKEAPLVLSEGEITRVASIEAFSTWLLAAVLRNNISSYFKILASAILWLPVLSVADYYVSLKPIYADEEWEERQADDYATQQSKLMGERLALIRSRFTSFRENAIISKLRSQFENDLSRHSLDDFLRLSWAARKQGLSDADENQGEAASIPIILICEAMACYLRAIQLWAGNSEPDQDSAIRRLLASLGILDRAKKISGGVKFSKLLIEMQRLFLIVYSSFVAFRYMHRHGGVRGFSLLQSFGLANAAIASQVSFLNAESRFKIVEKVIFDLDRRKKLIKGSSFIGIASVHPNRHVRVKRWSGDTLLIKSDLQSFQLSHGEGDGQYLFAQRLDDGASATTRGELYVKSVLDTYFPVKHYPREMRMALFASNSWLILVCRGDVRQELLWGGENHQALVRRLGLARFTLVPAKKNALSFLRNFVGVTWEILEVKELASGRVLIIHDARFEGIATLTKLVGFFRSLQEMTAVFPPLQPLMERVHLVARADNTDEIVRFENVLKAHLRGLEARNSSRLPIEGEEISSYQEEVDEILNGQILLHYDDQVMSSEFIEVSSRVCGLAGASIVFAEAS